MIVRPAESRDQQALAALAETAGLFPAAALPDMIAPYLAGAAEPLWLTAEDEQGLAGFLYADAEFLTVGTYNLRAMATREAVRSRGFGSALVAQCEQALAERRGHVLLVETSSTEPFAPTRQFYLGRGFREEARISGFWGPGDDKVIYWKALGG